MPQIPANGAMLTTEDVINQELTADFDRARIKKFLSRNDVIVQLKSYGISAEEAQARVESLTDQEIALIAGKLDQLPAGAGADLGAAIGALIAPYILIAVGIFTVIVLIIMYALDEGPNKPTYRKF
jgi:hypothetical protein